MRDRGRVWAYEAHTFFLSRTADCLTMAAVVECFAYVDPTASERVITKLSISGEGERG